MDETVEGIVTKQVSLPVAIGAGILALGGGLVIGYILGRRSDRPKPLSEEDQEVVDQIQAEMAEARRKRDVPRVDLSALKDRIDETEIDPKDIHGDHEPTFDGKPGGIVIDEEKYREWHGKARERPLYIVPQPEAPEPEPVTANNHAIRRNVFADQVDPEDDWDYEVELKRRNSSNPYVIHRDEFFEETDEFDFTQRQLTWYNGDGVLVDEERTPVYNHTDVVGELKFGHGSGDPNVVYIRNERLKAEYEVCLDDGRYDVEVQGVDIEDLTAEEDLRHAHLPRRFRTE